MSDYPAPFTHCRLCHEGQQMMERIGVFPNAPAPYYRFDVAVYRSRCGTCGDGFDVRVPADTPEIERKSLRAWAGDVVWAGLEEVPSALPVEEEQ